MTWRKMKHAYRDGRHLILRVRKTGDVSAFDDVRRWNGGVLAHWNEEDDQWWVICNPEAFGSGGTGMQCDSHWFSGWKLLPDALYKPEAVEPR